WDYNNSLTQVLLATGVRNTMSYDGDARRVRKDDSSGTSKFVWDQQNILLETDQNDAMQAMYSLEPAEYGNLATQYRGGQSQFFLFDGLGSTDRLTDISGTVTDNYVYKAFGPIQASSGSSVNPFRYVGKQGYYFDLDYSQYFARARYYDPL